MGFNTKNIITDIGGKPVPQHYSPESDSYEPVKGKNGASYVELKGPGVDESGKLNVKVERAASNDAAVTDYTLSANDISILKGISKILQGGGVGALPTKLTESNVAIPVDIQGIMVNEGEALPVTVVNQASTTTKPIEVIDLVTAASVRNTTEVQIEMPDLSKYVKYDIYVLNSLDQVVRIAPWRHTAVILSDASIGRWSLDPDNSDGLSFSFRIPEKPSVGSGAYWLSEITPTVGNGTNANTPKTSNLFSRVNNTGTTGLLKLAYKAPAAAPTSGTLTIRFIGYLK